MEGDSAVNNSVDTVEDDLSLLESFDDSPLEALALIVQQESKWVENALGQIVRIGHNAALHSIRAGTALLQAETRVGRASFEQWIRDECGIGLDHATSYMRIAHYREEVREWLAGGGDGTWDGVRNAVRGLPPFRPAHVGQYAEGRETAIRLHQEGLSYKAIAVVCGVSATTVAGWVDPEARRKHNAWSSSYQKRLRAGRRALAAQELAAEIKNRGGSAAEAYVLIRKCALALDAATASVTDSDEREAFRSAVAAAHKVEDCIVKALRLERRS